MKQAGYLLIFFLMSCATETHLTQTVNGYLIVDSRNFRLKNQFTLIDTTLLSSYVKYKLTCNESDIWLTFFPNGRVLRTSVSYQDKEVNRIGHLCGYYKLERNILTIEITAGYTTALKSDWGVLLVKGTIVGDTLKFSSDRWRNKGKNIGSYTKLKNIDGQPCYFIRSNGVSKDVVIPDW